MDVVLKNMDDRLKALESKLLTFRYGLWLLQMGLSETHKILMTSRDYNEWTINKKL